LIPVSNGSRSWRTRSAMTSSSSDALPARSPMPLIVHSICRTPPSMAARLLATARPRSSWQCVLKIALSELGTRWRISMKKSRISSGTVYPTVSGRLMVVAPAAMAPSTTRQRKSRSLRVASSAENSTSSVNRRASFTALTAESRHSSRVMRSLAERCRSDVARNVWMRDRSASSTRAARQCPRDGSGRARR
jgi:hypothetical protein